MQTNDTWAKSLARPSLILCMSLLIASCGGGDAIEPQAAPMSSPTRAVVADYQCTAAQVDARSVTRLSVIDGQCVRTSTEIESDPRAKALASPRMPTTGALLDWAETAFPQFFPSRRITQSLPPYLYRYYPESGNYLGVADGKIYALGPLVGSNSEPAYIGLVADFSCNVYPQDCVVANVKPTANAGAGQTTVAGSIVTLDGRASSDPNGDALGFQWSLFTRPVGSAAFLVSSNTSRPAFLADVAGVYVLTLTVNDGQLSSAPASATIVATAPTASIVTLFLYGGVNRNVYLGCLNCSEFGSEAICNRFGTYGSEFSSLSIWNQFGTYGSTFSSSSPWNQFSSLGVLIIGSDQRNYGVMTVNTFAANRTSIGYVNQTLNFFLGSGSHAATRNFLCGA